MTSTDYTKTCPHCGATLQAMTALLCDGLPQYIADMPMTCECPGAIAEREADEADFRKREDARRLNAVKNASGMPFLPLSRTFGNYDPQNDSERAGEALARDFAKMYLKGTLGARHSLIISGKPGTGKTHLAAAIANAIMSRYRYVTYRAYTDMLKDFRDTYSSRSTVGESEILRKYSTCSLLIIDDLGKGNKSAWEINKLYEIIDARYRDCKSTVITTNYGQRSLVERLTPPTKPGETQDDETAQAIVSRIMEMCQGITLTTHDHRTQR